MALNQSALTALAASLGSTALFDRVFMRMTGTECIRALTYGSLITGTPTVPSDCTAEGALTDLDYNSGNGSYITTSPYRYSGGVLTTSPARAYQARTDLKTSFNADRSAWLAGATNNDDVRATELIVDRPPNVTAADLTPTKLYFWDVNLYDAMLSAYPTIGSRSNLIRPVQTVFSGSAISPTASAMAALLAAQPAGRRYIYTNTAAPIIGIPVTSGAANGRYAIYDREFDHASRRGISLSDWWTAISASNSIFRTYLAALKVAGAALVGGTGAAILDGFVTDIERRQIFTQIGSDFTNIFSDASWSATRLLIKPVLTQGVWDTFAGWAATDERVFLYDAWSAAYWGSYMEQLAGLITAVFPGCDTYDYQTSMECPGTQPTCLHNTHVGTPYGRGESFGGISPSLYGLDFLGGRWNWPTLASQDLTVAWVVVSANTTTNVITSGTQAFTTGTIVRFTGSVPTGVTVGTLYYVRVVVSGTQFTLHPTLADANADTNAIDITVTGTGVVYDVRLQNWASLTTNLAMLRSSYAATTKPMRAWIGTENLILNGIDASLVLGTRGNWQELILHVALKGDLVSYYQSGPPTASAAEQKTVVDLIAERDAVVGYGAALELQAGIPSYTPGLLYHRVYAGNRWVYRVSPYDAVTTTASESTVGQVTTVTIANSLTTLTIPNARIHSSSQSALAPLGWWVEQFSDAVAAIIQVGGEVGTGSASGGVL